MQIISKTGVIYRGLYRGLQGPFRGPYRGLYRGLTGGHAAPLYLCYKVSYLEITTA